MTPMFFAPSANLVYETGKILSFNLAGFYISEAGVTTRISAQYSLLAFGILICALNLIIIFMYKSRVLQIRLCIYNILLLIGMTGVVMFLLHTLQYNPSVKFRLPMVFPVVSAILHYLAFRSIRKDELMVLALSRLR